MARRRSTAGGSTGERHEWRRRMVLAVVLAGMMGLLWRGFELSVLEHGTWQLRAEDQHGDSVTIPAARGAIFDRDQVPLASSREVYTVAVARREVQDTPLVMKRLREDLRLSALAAREVFRARRTWYVIPGRFEEITREKLSGIQGLHFQPVMQRFYPQGDLARELLGRVNASGIVLGGLEQELDSVLAGRHGRAIKRVDSRGRPIAGAMVRILEPSPGRDVVLTIDVDLQEIATDALREALATTGAESAEMLIVNPHTGEVLAAVSSARGERRTTWAAATEPYEPGSTIKPFTIASLLSEQRATLDDRFHGENGSFRLHGRTINDVKGQEWLTLREAFLVSSNIVMAKAAARLGDDAQYQRLRDFGFGSPTGIGYPGESAGRLWTIDHWSRQSPASLAFGYEIAVTPLQLAMAYAAIANGGVLLEPVLVREVRARDGAIQRAAPQRIVRRVIAHDIAEQVRSLLGEVVERGTGQNASLGDWKVAGKTGTARLVANGRYLPGAYIATFAGFFPADDPQIVFLVKLDRPRGDYYGGLTAAPVTRATLQAALAARSTPLDRTALAGVDRPGTGSETAKATGTGTGSGAGVGSGTNTDQGVCLSCPRLVAAGAQEPVVLRPAVAVREGPRDSETVAIPDVNGASLRDAARVLHAAGFRVRVEGVGDVASTVPGAGERAKAGRVVVVRLGGGV